MYASDIMNHDRCLWLLVNVVIRSTMSNTGSDS